MNPRFIEEMSWRMGEVYAAVTDQILINLARHFKYIKEGQEIGGAWQYQITKLAEMGQVNRETEQIILNMLGDADGALRAVLESAIVEGLKDAEKPLRNAAEKGLLMGGGFIPPEVEPSQMQAFRAYYRQSADKLNLVNTVMLESTENAYRATVSDIVTRMSATQDILNVAAGEVVSGVSSMNQAVRQSVLKMVENGITGFIDKGGHHWSPEAYVTMDIRTTMANTAREAVFERQEDYGNDLYQVSHHDGARPLCYPWQGKVISRADASREVEDDEGNKVHVYAQSETSYGEPAGLFGINCGHYPIPFIPGFSKIRPPTQNKEENDKEYQLSQEQRQLERNLRAEKRDLEVLKAQGASDEEIKAQRLRVKAARDNLNDFCDETGRARRSSREATPIKATWPDGYEPPKPPTRINPTTPPPTGNVTVQNVASQATSGTISRDMFKNVQGVDDSFKVGMADALIASNATESKQVFAKYADQLVCNQNNKKSGAFFRATSGGVYMNASAVAAGSNYETPYEVAFHEFGHMIDWIAGGKNNYTYLSNKPVNGKSLLDTIRNDYEAFKKSLGAKTNNDVIAALKAENLDLKARGNISDILEKCTGRSYPLGVGHGVKYHRQNGATEKEFFAEVLDSSITNQASFDQMKRLFPNAVDMVFEMIKGVI